MKQILGDNQFFGVNHYDIDKGDKSKEMFSSDESIINFIHNAIDIGMDGFMINSNSRGYDIVNNISKTTKCEFHFSIPYPHKFASIVNENGMFELLRYVFKKSSYRSLLVHLPFFVIRGNVNRIIPLILDLEIPKNLPKGSYVYLQNIVTDLLLGMKRYDLIESYCKYIIKKGYLPGLITLNPILLDKLITTLSFKFEKDLIVCFNINQLGFNVFPNKKDVEKFVFSKTVYKKMGMSILSSGGASNIVESLDYIKKLPLDYVVYGSSKIMNIQINYNLLNKNC
jgi:hypothetical protein